jgi:DNA-binding NarL/FixJ family response regulator
MSHEDKPARDSGDEPVTVGIVEDDAGTRASLQAMIDAAPTCSCIAACKSAAEAIAVLPAKAPRVVIVDINLGMASGVDCVRALAPQMPDTEFVMLTVYQDGNVLFEALSAGAHGYLIKPVRSHELIEAIHDVVSGGAPISSVVARKIVRFFERTPTVKVDPPAPDDVDLGPREREVLELLAAGAMYKEVARALGVSPNTVRSHIRRIYKKLHVHSRHHAVEHYLRLR